MSLSENMCYPYSIIDLKCSPNVDVVYMCGLLMCCTCGISVYLESISGGIILSEKHWKIGEFAKEIGKHKNTIDGWFRALEEERKLHYVSRLSNNEKVYDELDFNIAQYIIKQRTSGWSLDAIFDSLPEVFDLRPFPLEYEAHEKSVQVVDVDKIRATIMNEMKATFEQISATQMAVQMKEFQRMLPSPAEARLERFNAVMAQRKVQRVLEREALDLWASEPPERRMKRIGFFKRQQEDTDERDRFVNDYVDSRFETRLKEEFGLDDSE